MEWFAAQHQMTIKDELISLGFVDPERIIGRAEEADDPRDPSVKACIFDEVTVNEHLISDLFFLIKERPDGSWHIDGIIASVQMETARNIEGVMIIQKAYPLGNGPLPMVEQIKTEIGDLVGYEQYAEFFFIKNDPAMQFGKLGFENYYDIIQTARHSGNITRVVTNENITLPNGSGREKINFQFVLISDRQKDSIHVAFIKAYVSTEGPNADKMREDTEMGFYPINGQLPDKTLMIHEVLSRVELDKSEYERVRQRFRPDENMVNARRQSNHQGRLHL